MKNIIIGSVTENAGKTSFIIGLAKAMDKKFSYLKPFGDKLVYRKKRLWDYDAALITNIFGLEQSSDEMTIGFEHAKLRYVYDEASVKTKLLEMMKHLSNSGGTLFTEGGKNLTYGTSVQLDTLSLVKHMGGKLVLVISGDEGTVIDDITFVKKYIDTADINYSVVINKVANLDDYMNNHLPDIKNMGVDVLGVIPNEPDLTYISMGYAAEKIQARVIAGEGGMKNWIKHIVVGSMSGDVAVRDPRFQLENKLIIASGDRSDHVLAALVSSTAGIIITNNMLPPQNLVSKVAEKNIPLLLVPYSTFETAKMIDDMTPMLTRDDTERIELLHQMVAKHVNIKGLTG
jgi:BioD-like phosphotransacetylase family protein